MEGVGYRLALPPPRHDKLADFRVLAVTANPLCPTAASVSGAIDSLADRLTKAGCRVSRDSAKMPSLARTTRNYAELLLAFYGLDLSPDERAQAEAAAKVLSPEDQSIEAYRLRGLTIGHPEYLRASRVRDELRARWQALFEDVDVVLCPCMPTPAFPHDHSKPQYRRQIDIDGKKVPYDDQIVWAGIATLTGLPATAAPIGRSEAGLPVGAQIIGGFLEDRTTIGFAGLVEREFGGFVPPPNL